MYKLSSTLLLLICLSLTNKAQDLKIKSSTYQERSTSLAIQENLVKKSLAKDISFRSVGPTIMSGRVVDLEVNPSKPTEFYVAYATGGLWKTENNGISFTCIFDKEESITIGDFAVDWKNKHIWIGTGENNSSRSSYAGTGMFMSKDDGKTWTKKGLSESQHVGKVIIHPKDTNIIFVGVIGNLFSNSKERGVYKTTDGGKTWKNILFVSNNAGCIDMQMDPSNPNILYAAFWERERKAWDFKESGINSGIYKTTDAGNSWKNISGPNSGLNFGTGTGRIGINVFEKNPNVIFAIVDNQDARPEKEKKDDKLTKKEIRKMSKEDFLKVDNSLLDEFLRNNDFPEKYKAIDIKTKIKKDELKPIQLVEYLEDANALLFEREIIGPEIFKSSNGGITWKKQNQDFIDETFFSYGYYFGRMWMHPNDSNKIYVSGLFPLKSKDGGKTFERLLAGNVHADHHSLWIDPNLDGHLINGNDGGVNISYDDGKTWFKANSPAVGQFYTVNYDMEKPYNVYGGLQDNGVWTGSSKSDPNDISWMQEGKNDFKSIMGGDGMQVKIDYRDNKTIYTGYQFGNYYRVNKETGDAKYITPKHDLGERPFRWNWQAPITVSSHNADIIYMGSQKFHRSMDKGDNFKTLSSDLTKGGIKGDVPYGTITQIEESPLRFGLIYVGTDDGLVHISKDAGYTWEKISDALPQNLWVRKIAVSNFVQGRVYLCLNGHTFDHFNSYLYKSDNYGKTWEAIGKDLPFEPINVIKEDTENENLLFVGTDHGVYFSLDRGNSFMKMEKDLPAVPVHDLVIQPREHDLILGTHGRSIYIAPIGNLEKLVDSNLNKTLLVFDDSYEKMHSKNWGMKNRAWSEPSSPIMLTSFYNAKDINIQFKIQTDSGIVLWQKDSSFTAGIHELGYDLSIDSNFKESIAANAKWKNGVIKTADNGKSYLPIGKYSLVFIVDGKPVGKRLIKIEDNKSNTKRAAPNPVEAD